MATRTISVAGGNFDSLATWDEGIKPVAGDAVVARAGGNSGNLTVNVPSACASFVMTNYVGTLTMDSTLTFTTTCTFVPGMTIAGTAGTLVSGANTTLTSGGKTLTCGLTFQNPNIHTFADAWVVNGLLTLTGTTGTMTLNGFTLTCAGGITRTGTTVVLAGTTKLILTGGTWSAATSGEIRNNVDLQGNVTVSGSVAFGTAATLKYVSGTITTTGSTLVLNGVGPTTPQIDTVGMTWNNLTFNGVATTHNFVTGLAYSGTLTCSTNNVTFTGAALSGTGAVVVGAAITLTLNNTGGLVTTGTLTNPNADVTWAGSAGFTVGTLTNTTYTASRIVTLTFGNTYTVTGTISNVGTTAAIRQAIKSGTPGSKVVLNLQSGGTADLLYCDPTDVNSSGGKEILTVRGAITTSTNWATAATLPAVTNVRSGTVYGGGTGTMTEPAQADVRSGVQYGAGGTEFTGSLVASTSMTIARTTGALIGTDETTGVTLAAGAVVASSTTDLLADNTSYGNVSLYLVFTPSSVPTSGSISILLEEGRTSSALYVNPANQPRERAAYGLPAAQQKIHLGKIGSSRYLKVTVQNKSNVALSGVAVLYELEKVT